MKIPGSGPEDPVVLGDDFLFLPGVLVGCVCLFGYSATDHWCHCTGRSFAFGGNSDDETASDENEAPAQESEK